MTRPSKDLFHEKRSSFAVPEKLKFIEMQRNKKLFISVTHFAFFINLKRGYFIINLVQPHTLSGQKLRCVHIVSV